jgi:hypothetical protein
VLAADLVTISDGVSALRRVSALIAKRPVLLDAARAPLVLRDIDGLAGRLEDPDEREWDLGPNFAFLAPVDIGSVVMARDILDASGLPDAKTRHDLDALENFLRRFFNCWI